MKINFMKKAAILSLAIGIIFSTANITNAKESFDWDAERTREEKIFDDFAKKHPPSNSSLPSNEVGGILITKDSSFSPSVQFIGHAGIIKGNGRTIESNPKNGVYSDYTSSWDNRRTCYVLIVGQHCKVRKNQTPDANWSPGESARDWCENQIGKPYNPWYWNHNDTTKFYCSQLVWMGYRDGAGINLCSKAWNIVSPSDILNSSYATCIWSK